MVYDKAWNVAYRRDRDAGRRRYVDAAPTRERLQSLVDASVPVRTVARVAGLSATTISTILDGTQARVQRATAQRVHHLSVAGVYASVSTGHVPRVGATRRVQALLALGWPHHHLGAAGISNSAQIVGAPGDLITVRRWRQVRDVYDALSMTPGPSPETRGWAAKLGYAPPLAWDEDTIDDPDAAPDRAGSSTDHDDGAVVDAVAVARAAAAPWHAVALTAAEARAVVAVMAAAGASDAVIATHVQVSDRTVLRWRTRDAIPPGQPRTGPHARTPARVTAGDGDVTCAPDPAADTDWEWQAREAREATTTHRHHRRQAPPTAAGATPGASPRR